MQRARCNAWRTRRKGYSRLAKYHRHGPGMQTGVTGDEIVLKGASSLSPILEQLFGSGLFKASQMYRSLWRESCCVLLRARVSRCRVTWNNSFELYWRPSEIVCSGPCGRAVGFLQPCNDFVGSELSVPAARLALGHVSMTWAANHCFRRDGRDLNRNARVSKASHFWICR